MKKRLLVFITVLLTVSFAVPSFSATVIYENRSQTVLAKNLTYELNRQITNEGMLDVHVVTVPLNNPHMYVGPVTSSKELGLKESASNILSDAGALAGVNGDFFGMAGLYSVPFGPVIADGQVQSISATTNQNKNEFAAFILNPDNSTMMKYLKAEIHFYNNGVENIEIGTYNKTGADLEWPVIVDKQYMPNTNSLDARFTGLWKIVVSGRAITYVSQLSEKVEIPDDGYAVVVPARLYDSYRYKFNVGDSASFSLGNNIGVSLTGLKSAIGGGGLVLSGGAVVHDGGTVISGRQPRTAVGVSQDGSKLFLMTVDGRSHSIGATHDELAALMLRYGAWDAMHLDGGGSSTMVYKEPDKEEYTVANTPSDGAERRIINTLGVFDRSPQGGAAELDVFLSQSKVFRNTAVIAEAAGRDMYGHIVELPTDEKSTIYAEPADGGYWSGNVYTPIKAGLQTIQVLRDGSNAWQYLWVYDIAELNCSTDAIRTLPGLSTPLEFSGIATDGTELSADYGVNVNVVPENLGVWENGQFTASATGQGFLQCTVGSVSTYVKVTVGGFASALNTFNVDNTDFEGYPAVVSGTVYTEPAGSTEITRFGYYFAESGSTQAAYMVFNPPVSIYGNPMALSLNVMGDGAGHWLRGRITDAAGKEFTVDFSRSVDSLDWEKVTAFIPEEAQKPITLDRVYFAATENPVKASYLAYFDALEVMYEPENSVNVPEGQKFTDPMMSKTPPYELSSGLFAIPAAGDGSAYKSQKLGNMAVVNLSASKGGIIDTDVSQWAKIEPDINALTPEAVLVLVDYNPLSFRREKEFELLHTILSYHRNTLLRPVFVVSATGGAATLTMRDGIRYIDLTKGTKNVMVWEEDGEYYWGEALRE